jgi:hypothetical protein
VVPEHVPIVYLYQGTCDDKSRPGDCTWVPKEYEGDVATKLGEVEPGLRWLPQNADIEIFGEEKKVKLNNTGRERMFGGEREAPTSAGQTADFRWVPSMDALTGGHGRVRDDCLYWVGDCPISARFKVRGGEAKTCHLFHFPEENQQGESRMVVVFEYKTKDREPAIVRTQAVADAVQVEFEVEGKYVELRAWEFPTASGQQRLKKAVKLLPDNHHRVTLIVSNGPRHWEKEEDYCGPTHQDVLFDLLARERASHLTRAKTRCEPVSPGSCEAEITALAQAEFKRASSKHARFVAKEDRREVPHATTVCDGASYP